MLRPEQDAAEALRYADPELRARLYRRTLRVVLFSQVLGGAGLAAGVTVGALLAQDLLGTESLAGLPAALLTLGSAGAAYGVGRLSGVAGRRRGLATGFLTGAVGAVGIVVAAAASSAVLFFLALLVYGAGTATNLQARYAGTDLAPDDQRGRAVSVAMVATTLGAVAGPNLVNLTGELAQGVGLPPLAGPFALAAIAYGAAGLALLVLLRPDPYLVARELAAHEARMGVAAVPAPSGPGAVSLAPVAGGRLNRGVTVGAAVMVVTQVAMVAIMTMTPVHMRHHGHSLAEVGFVIGVHIGAMYLPSLVTGRLVDRFGRLPMAVAAGVTLLLAGVTSAVAPTDTGSAMLWLTAALALLGLGWNFGLIAGTAMVIDSTPLATRARTQGKVDVLIALAGASGGALSGFVVAQTSYATLSLAGGLLSLALVPVVAWMRAEPQDPVRER